ncbi:MAG: hypothetical protein JWO89_1711 [Verrucomicrobiaceae bacterium]|nr:hypothetical protein [Verrucomicrobiaceae bacterium]
MSTPLCPPSIDSVEDLRQLQRLMGVAMYRPLVNDDEELAPEWTDGRPMAEMVGEFIRPNDRLTSEERLAIYSRSYWFRILDCLYDDFPGLRSVLGAKKFHAFARAYLASCPSSSWTLRNLGNRILPFIDQHPEWTAPRTAIARDIAHFEWAQVLAFDEARNEPLHGDDLLGSNPDELRLGLQPYLVFLEVNYAVDDYFMAVRNRDAGMRGEASNTLDHAPVRAAVRRLALPKKQKLWLAVHRCDTDVYFKRITHEAFLLFTALQSGQSVSAALEIALQQADPGEDWAKLVKEWFENAATLGWFCARREP